MKNVMLMAVGAVGLYEAARRFGLIPEQKIKDYVSRVWDEVNIREFLNVEKLKEMVGLHRDEPAVATA